MKITEARESAAYVLSDDVDPVTFHSWGALSAVVDTLRRSTKTANKALGDAVETRMLKHLANCDAEHASFRASH